MKTWITSDWHFNHTNICGPNVSSWSKGYRNFSSLEEMNAIILDNLNSVIDKDDILFFLGDFAFGNKKLIPKHRSKIRCRNIHFICGNHDEAIVQDYRQEFSTFKMYDEIVYNRVKVVLFHFPIASWHKVGSGSVHAFGHCHGSFTEDLGRAMDVGVDTNNMKPYLLDEVVDKLMAKPLVSGRDHHL